MNGNNISEKNIKRILRNKVDMLEDIDRKVAALLSEMNEEDIIRERCLQTVRLILDSPYYTIMNRLYVEKGLYFTVQQELNMSQSQFERHRKKAIRKIKDYAERNSSDFIMDCNDKQILYG